MQRSRTLIVTLACLTVVTACVTLAPGADKVRVTSSPADVTACKPVGNIRIPLSPQLDVFEMANAELEFRNQIVGLAGNTGLVTSALLGAYEGIAYQCP